MRIHVYGIDTAENTELVATNYGIYGIVIPCMYILKGKKIDRPIDRTSGVN